MIAKDLFPFLFFESKKIRALRRDIQKPYRKEKDFFIFFVLRPISIYFSLIIHNYTKIQANHITFLMLVLSFCSPLLLLFFQKAFLVVSVSFSMMFFFILFLDVIDGEVARLRQRTSQLGEVVDAGLWYFLPLMYASLCITIVLVFELPLWIAIVNLMTVSLEMYVLMISQHFTNRENAATFVTTDDRQIIFRDFIKLLLSRTMFFLLSPLIILIDIHYTEFNLIEIYLIFLACIYMAFNIYKFMTSIKQFRT